MVKLFVPRYADLWFRKQLLADEATMSYNHAWGGTIDFPECKWEDWYDRWLINTEGKRFYRYLQDAFSHGFVGEVAYHFNGKEHVADVIVDAKYRGNGFGKEGLQLLCDAAKDKGVEFLYDDIAIDNPAIELFLENGFHEEYRTKEIIMLKKKL